MRPLAELSAAEIQAVTTVAFDLDDTLLDQQALSEPAYGALFRLRQAGFRLVACTGRPAGFADVIMRQWPIDGAVSENGAIAFVRGPDGRTRVLDDVPPGERLSRRARLCELAERIQAAHPELARADDDWARKSDVALDHGEHQRVGREVIASAQEMARLAGARTFVSSIHLHLSFDTFDKASGLLAYARATDTEPRAAREGFAYVGDSANDAPAFAAFALTFGVANVRRHLAALEKKPRFVADGECGAGFVQIAERLCALTRARSLSDG